MAPLKQYDCVRVVALKKAIKFEPGTVNVRPPKVGDLATIVEVYTNPEGFELECSGKDGVTEWLLAFDPQDIELELVGA